MDARLQQLQHWLQQQLQITDYHIAPASAASKGPNIPSASAMTSAPIKMIESRNLRFAITNPLRRQDLTIDN